MTKINMRVAKATKAGGSDIFVWDDDLPGFGLRVKPSGVKSFMVQYRNAYGRSRRLTIGRYGEFSPEQARREARQLLAASARGIDPAADREALREAPKVDRLLDRYLAEHVRMRNSQRTRAEVERLVDLHIRPALGKLAVTAVTRADLVKLHSGLSKTPRQANFALAVCSKAFNLAEMWGMRPEGSNPCRRIDRYPERSRERFLSADELSRLGEVLDLAETIGLPWKMLRTSTHSRKAANQRTVLPRSVTDLIRLLLFTGCRLSDVLTLRWHHVDLAEGVAVLPAPKGGKPIRKLLSAAAIELLSKTTRYRASPFVFPMLTDPERPFSKDTIEGMWQRIVAAACLEGSPIARSAPYRRHLCRPERSQRVLGPGSARPSHSRNDGPICEPRCGPVARACRSGFRPDQGGVVHAEMRLPLAITSRPLCCLALCSVTQGTAAR
jgi:integrase